MGVFTCDLFILDGRVDRVTPVERVRDRLPMGWEVLEQ